VEAAPAELTELLHEFTGIRLGEFPGFFGERAEAVAQ
jgi:hypothetical protein